MCSAAIRMWSSPARSSPEWLIHVWYFLAGCYAVITETRWWGVRRHSQKMSAGGEGRFIPIRCRWLSDILCWKSPMRISLSYMYMLFRSTRSVRSVCLSWSRVGLLCEVVRLVGGIVEVAWLLCSRWKAYNARTAVWSPSAPWKRKMCMRPSWLKR